MSGKGEVPSPAILALIDAAKEIREALEPAMAELNVILAVDPVRLRTHNVKAAVERVLAYVTSRMDLAARARQVEPKPDLIRIRRLSAIETRLEVALEAVEAAKDIDEDALRVLDSNDGLTRAYDMIKRVQMAVRMALSRDNATPYG